MTNDLPGCRELAAEEVYNAMLWAAAAKGKPEPWVSGGNSFAQAEARDTADRILKQARAAETGWLPISSAPVGERVILGEHNGVQWLQGMGMIISMPGTGPFGITHDSDGPNQPTHWQPLPLPPAPAATAPEKPEE